MVIKKNILIALLVFLNLKSFCVAQNIIKDTSYTVNSSFEKYKSKFLAIEIVKPKQYLNISETENILYKTIENRSLCLDAFINKKENSPTVILVHGGGWKSGNKSHMKPLAQYIASKGYSCFAIEYRLSDEAKYPEGIYDIKEAIKYIKLNAKQFHIDTTKVAILGASSGAQMATFVGVTNNNLKFEKDSNHKISSSIQAIINLDGILAFKHPESKEGEMANYWLGGSYEEKSEIWKEASPLTHADKNSPPILFVNSQYDRFHAGRDDMITILDKHNIYSKVVTIKNSPHTFWLFSPYFKEITKHIVTFLNDQFKSN